MARRCSGRTTRSQAAPTRCCIRDLDQTRIEVIIRKGFRVALDSYSAFFENDHATATGLDGWLRQRGFRQLFLVRPGDRFLRRLVGRGRGAAGL